MGEKQNEYNKAIGIIAVIVLGVVFSAIMGWLFQIQYLTSVWPSYSSLKMNTAIALACSCIALILLMQRKFNIVFYALTICSALISGITLAEYIWSIDAGIDEWLVKDITLRIYPGRMAVTTAFCLFILNIGLWGASCSIRWCKWISQLFFHVSTFMAFVAIVGYFYSVPSLYRFSFLSAMALPTAISIFLFSIAASLINPYLLVTGLFTGDKIGNRMARRLFPATVFSVLVLAFLRIESHRLSFITVEFGISLLAVSFIIVSVFLIWDASNMLNAIDEERELAEDALFELNQNLEELVTERTQELNRMVIQLNDNQRILKRNKALLRGLFDNTEIAIFVKDKNGQYLMANEAFAKPLNKSVEEVIGKTIYDLVDAKLADKLTKEDRELFRTDEPLIYQMNYPSPEGEKISLIHKFTIKDEQGETYALCCLSTDVSLLSKTQNNLRAIIQSAAVSIISTDTQGIIKEFNKGAELLLGYDASEMINKQTPQLFHLEKEVLKRSEELTSQLGYPVEGFRVFVELPSNGQSESRKWTYKRKDGVLVPVQLAVNAIRDERGVIKGYLGIATDISALEESKQELQALSDQLQSQNRQLVNFAHITSHNLRAPVSNLNSLLMLYDLSESQAERDEVFGNFSGVIHHLSETLNELVDSLKVQRDLGKERTLLSFEEIFQKTKEILSGQAIENRALISGDFSEAPEVLYPKSYLESIMLNLMSNAIKYRSPDRTPEIYFKTYKEKGRVVLTVKDNGLGLDMKQQGHKLFGFNKTFHRHPDAKGIGLFMTKTQVEAMGGEISGEGEVDKGMTFKVVFNK